MCRRVRDLHVPDGIITWLGQLRNNKDISLCSTVLDSIKEKNSGGSNKIIRLRVDYRAGRLVAYTNIYYQGHFQEKHTYNSDEPTVIPKDIKKRFRFFRVENHGDTPISKRFRITWNHFPRIVISGMTVQLTLHIKYGMRYALTLCIKQ